MSHQVFRCEYGIRGHHEPRLFPAPEVGYPNLALKSRIHHVQQKGQEGRRKSNATLACSGVAHFARTDYIDAKHS